MGNFVDLEASIQFRSVALPFAATSVVGKSWSMIKQSNTPSNECGIDGFATLKSQRSSKVAWATGRYPRPRVHCHAQIVLASDAEAYYVIF